MNYLIISDGECSSIEFSEKEPDAYEVYGTLAEAKRELQGILRDRVNGLRDRIRFLKTMRVSDVDPPTN